MPLLICGEVNTNEEKGFIRNMKLFDTIGTLTKNPQIFIQTFCPQHPFIQKIQHRDFSKFFSTEISARKSLEYPPFSTSLQFIKNAKNQETLEKNFIEIQKKIYPFCIKIFPIQISYHPQRNLYTAKMLCFTHKELEIWKIIQ